MTWCFNCLYCISPLLILLWVYIDRSERDLVKKADPTAGRREMAILVEWQQVPTVTVAQLLIGEKKMDIKIFLHEIEYWWHICCFEIVLIIINYYFFVIYWNVSPIDAILMFYSCFWISKWTLKKILIFLLTMILCIDFNCFCFVFKYWNLLPYI